MGSEGVQTLNPRAQGLKRCKSLGLLGGDYGAAGSSGWGLGVLEAVFGGSGSGVSGRRGLGALGFGVQDVASTSRFRGLGVVGLGVQVFRPLPSKSL